jgi:uncharacterized protein
MNYFDTSFLIPFFLDEQASTRVDRFMRRKREGELAISLWTRVEFSSAIARQMRVGRLTEQDARRIDSEFDEVTAASFVTLAPTAADFELSRQFLRRYETALRAGDALHLAVAANNQARAIYSLDQGLLKAGRLLGLPTESVPR